MALGMGIVLGIGLLYGLATSETAQIIALAIAMFVMGSLMMAVFLTYAVKAIATGFGAKKEETHYHMLPGGQRAELGPGSDWMLESPRRAEQLLPRLPVGGEVVEGEDEFVA